MATQATRIDGIIKYLKEGNAEINDLERLDIQDGDTEDAGWLIEASACNPDGVHEPHLDCKMIIPDLWDGALFKSSNGWDWLAFDKSHVNAEDIRLMVVCDRSLAPDEVETEVRGICDKVGVKYEGRK